MLPFLKPKTVAGLIISKRKADGGVQEQHTEGQEHAPLEAASEDLLRAFNAKDARAIAAALSAAWEILSNGSQDEGTEESASPHTYDSQNQKAAK